MKLYFNVKQVGSRRNYITKEEMILDLVPSCLRELIETIVTHSVNHFNDRLKENKLVDYLTNEVMDDKLTVGRISFDQIHNQTEQNLSKALATAYLAYEDGIYKVFVGDKEAGLLDEPLELHDGDILTFVKLTMLSGRMW